MVLARWMARFGRNAAAVDERVIAVLLDTDNCPIVWVAGMPVTVCVVPLLKTSTSFVAGLVRVGVQFVVVAHDPPAVWFHVYVVCARTLGPIRARQNAAARKTLVLFIDPPSAVRPTAQNRFDAAPRTHALPEQVDGCLEIGWLPSDRNRY